MKSKKWYVYLLVFALMLGFSGCGQKTEENAGGVNQGNQNQENQQQDNLSGVSYPVTLTGSDGVSITLEAEPEKVISISPGITEMIYSLGAEGKLIARTDYCDYPEAVLSLSSIGTLYTPDAEKMLELDPDLIITSAFLDETLTKQLEDVGIKIINVYEDKEITGVYTMFDILGTALNKKEEAENVIQGMQDKIKNIEEKTAGLSPVSVYYVVGYGEGGEFTAGGDTYIHDLLTRAGGENIAADVNGWVYSLESLIEADPEVIIISSFMHDDFIKTEPYASLSAVKNQRVYGIDNNKLDRQSVRNAEAVEEIAKLLHPQAFE